MGLVNSNCVNIKNKNVVGAKINKAVISAVVQNNLIDISSSCNVVIKVSPRKVVLNNSSHDINNPVLTSKSATTVVESFSSSVLGQATDVDAQDAGLLLLVSEYVQDIYKHLWHMESQHRLPEGFLQEQKVSPQMRSTIIDWLIQLQVGYTLLPETLYLTVAIMDRYLAMEKLPSRNLMQLLAVTSMFIASKYEETAKAPSAAAFAYITDGACTWKDIVRMEIKVLSCLKGYVSFPLPLHFLRRNSKVGGTSPATHILSKYLLELCLTEYKLSTVPASLQAAAALCFSLNLLVAKSGHPIWLTTVATVRLISSQPCTAWQMW